MKLNLIITFLILILSKNLCASGKYDSAKFTDDKFSNTSESPKFGLWDVISMRSIQSGQAGLTGLLRSRLKL